jgi:mannan endo-1,4-beta-mannosidase
MIFDRARVTGRRDVLRFAAAIASTPFMEACAKMSSVPPPNTAPGATPAPLPPSVPLPGGLAVRGTRLVRDGRPFLVSGVNYWAGTLLAREAGPAGWDRARRDLDAMQSLGLNMVRVLGSAEGPDTEPFRAVPSIQYGVGKYDPQGVEGVLRFADELRRRGMFGIFVLNNFWPWSGGMAQYVAWSSGEPVPYPPPQPGGTFLGYMEFTARFYEDARAREVYRAYVRFLVPKLANNPAVVWELANEPRGMTHVPAYRGWIDETARLIKSLAPSQLVTTGSEGETASPLLAGIDVVRDHESPAIDFITCHVWAQNWGWVHPERLAEELPEALDLAERYLKHHAALASRAGKPILLEEFGFPRDGASFDPGAPTTLRDRYFGAIYAIVESLVASTPMAGIMPWAWSGATHPPRPGEYWRRGDPLVGDPPHEQQGWYGIYDGDPTTAVMRDGSAGLARVAAALGPAAAR